MKTTCVFILALAVADPVYAQGYGYGSTNPWQASGDADSWNTRTSTWWVTTLASGTFGGASPWASGGGPTITSTKTTTSTVTEEFSVLPIFSWTATALTASTWQPPPYGTTSSPTSTAKSWKSTSTSTSTFIPTSASTQLPLKTSQPLSVATTATKSTVPSWNSTFTTQTTAVATYGAGGGGGGGGGTTSSVGSAATTSAHPVYHGQAVSGRQASWVAVLVAVAFGVVCVL